MLEIMLKQAVVVAKMYRLNNRWASLEDMQQEAMAAVIEAAPSYDATKASPATYANMVAYRALSHWLMRNKGVVYNERLAKEAMRSKYESDDALKCVSAASESVDVVLAEEEAIALTSQRIAELMASGQEAALGCAVLMGERSAQVAKRTGVPVMEVYRATARFKSKVQADAVLREAWDAL